jgi:hypothetical protein
MTHLTDADELIHATGEDPNWREAWYFDFVDPVGRLSGFGYAGVHPNQEVGDVLFALWHDDGLLARYTWWDFNIPRDIGEERMGFGPLCFQLLQPFRRWTMYFDDGACRLDLGFEAIHAAYSWADSEFALAATHSHHYEQQGRYSGSVRVGGTEQCIEAVGVRDHAWGWGARAGIQRWLWASAQFGADFAFNTFQVGLGDGRDVLYGYLYHGGENRFLHRSRIQTCYAARGHAPESFDLGLQLRTGERFDASARVLNAFDISHQERNKQGYHHFCATEYRCAGRTGYGHTNVFWRKNALRPLDWSVG